MVDADSANISKRQSDVSATASVRQWQPAGSREIKTVIKRARA